MARSKYDSRRTTLETLRNRCNRELPLVKRWDGAAKTGAEWDNLHKDDELWMRNGNCLVYLYSKGQSRRGPSFKLPFENLLESSCYPLIGRFLDNGPTGKSPKDLQRWFRRDPKQTIELYIPPPRFSDRKHAFLYHLATRNLFAWVFRRSLVGEHLGAALIGLLHSMHQFRSGNPDNLVDMLDYMDEEGYLDVADQPHHAIALLNFSETFQLEEGYFQSLSHCVGMIGRLEGCPEYKCMSKASRKLVPRARRILNRRVEHATEVLHQFLDEDLSETNLGLPSGARAHLERFRSFLLSYYTVREGYYPPRQFKPKLFQSMRDDFEALYELLVDNHWTSTQQIPSVAVGGLCTIQMVEDFDSRNQFITPEHPLPLMPHFSQQSSSARLPWLWGGDNLKADQRSLAHAALIRASNWGEGIFSNRLVQAYRQFEEDSVLSPRKVDKSERVTVADARKIRWILIYAVYQVLRGITMPPTNDKDEPETSYHLAQVDYVCPPWHDAALEMGKLLRRQTQFVVGGDSSALAEAESLSAATERIEIKPDIDYFAINHKEAPTKELREFYVPTLGPNPSNPVQHSALTRALNRSGTLRQSIRRLRTGVSTTNLRIPLTRKSSHHEIVVHGYGNGTNDVNFGSEEQSQAMIGLSGQTAVANWQDSASIDSVTNSRSDDDHAVFDDTPDTPLTIPSPTLSKVEQATLEDEPKVTNSVHHRRSSAAVPAWDPSISIAAPKPGHSASNVFTNHEHAQAWDALHGHGHDHGAPPVPERRRPTGHHVQPPNRSGSFFDGISRSVSSKMPDLRRRSQLVDVEGQVNEALWAAPRPSEDWEAMQAFFDSGDYVGEIDEDAGFRNSAAAWEHYTDLGGLAEAR